MRMAAAKTPPLLIINMILSCHEEGSQWVMKAKAIIIKTYL